MGFAEHFGPDLIIENLEYLHVLNKKRRSVLRFGNAVQVFLKVGQLRIVVWFLDQMCNLHLHLCLKMGPSGLITTEENGFFLKYKKLIRVRA